MLDTKNVVYLPAWIKWSAIFLLAFSMIGSCTVALLFVGEPDRADWILVAMSVAQVAGTALILTLVVAFAERDANMSILADMTHRFLKIHVLDALKKITCPVTNEACSVELQGLNNIYGGNYAIKSSSGLNFGLWVGLNVYRVQVIYFLELDEQRTAERYASILKFTLDGARKVGYEVNQQVASLHGRHYLSIWSTLAYEHETLSSPQHKLFLTQDLAMMTQSVLNALHRDGLLPNHQQAPQPL